MHPFRIYGAAAKPSDPIALSAGALKLLFDNGEIRYLRLGDVEVLRRVYVAVRDQNWRTIPPKLSDLQVEQSQDSFQLSFRVDHNAGGIDFSWLGRITGTTTGEVRFEMRGKANTSFQTNRTGFCVLHPSACAGQVCVVERPDGSQEEGLFPRDISPHQPFENIRAIRHGVNNATIRVLMEGDVFEMEDQRNWSDASFKTYCRPLELPMPYELAAGQSVDQTITIQLQGDPSSVPSTINRKAPIRIDLAAESHGEWVPHVGLAVAEGFDQLDARSLGQLRSMHPRHLRLDLDLTSDRWRDKLAACAGNLKNVGVPIDAALTCPESPAEVIKDLADAWRQHALPVGNWLIFSARGVTTRAQANPARELLSSISPQALFGGGTNAEFVAVNRQHPPMEALDLICFALNPQVHAFDNLSIIENLQSQSELINSAIKVSGDRPVYVTPVTLRRRHNPDATGPDRLASATTLPASVDPRQMSLLAAAWTVGSLSRLCHADFLTYFETHGWRGVLQGNAGPALPELFPVEPGDLFPVYHVLKSFLSFFPEHWAAPTLDRPLELAALHLMRPDRHRLLLANLEPSPQRIALSLPGEATVTILDANSVDKAFRDADFWVNAESTRIEENSELELGDYAIAAVDWSLI